MCGCVRIEMQLSENKRPNPKVEPEPQEIATPQRIFFLKAAASFPMAFLAAASTGRT
jgi:hypothetical protein